MSRSTMTRTVMTKTLWDARGAIAGWCLALAGVSVLYAAFYPAINQEAFAQAMDAFPAAIMDAFGWSDLTSPAGYLGSTVFGLLAPVLLIVWAIGMGGRAVAGDEEAGTLDLLLAHPVARTTVVVHRALAMAVALAAGAAAVFLAVLLVRGPADLGALPVAHLAAGSVHIALLGLVVGSVALLLGAVTGRRSAAVGGAAFVAVVGYFANTIAANLPATAWMRTLSPFHYALGSEPLRHGLQAGEAAILLVASVVLVAVAAAAFRRRDVGV